MDKYKYKFFLKNTQKCNCLVMEIKNTQKCSTL